MSPYVGSRSLPYGNTTRKLYCLAMIESHSRMLILEFALSRRMTGQQPHSGQSAILLFDRRHLLSVHS